MDHEYKPDAGQEENYDELFKALDGQDIRDGDMPYIKLPDGKVQKLTFSNLLKTWWPIFVFLGGILVILIAVKIARMQELSDSSTPMMAAVVVFGLLFLFASVFFAFHDGKKARPMPMLAIPFYIGLISVYAGIATIVHNSHPYDMEAFKRCSALGFGILMIGTGLWMLVSNMRFKAKRCKKIYATCTKAQSSVKVNGRDMGTVTWEYDYEGIHYTAQTYNTFIEFCEGQQSSIYIDPENPENARSTDNSTPWGVSLMMFIAGGLAIWSFVGMG